MSPGKVLWLFMQGFSMKYYFGDAEVEISSGIVRL